MLHRPRVVVMGGGTGSFTLLSGLKQYPLDLTAIVTMADDGGSTGVLRDELGVLPPGDVRQCLVALSSSDRLMRDLMNYRFEKGKLKGHSFGNLFLSALEKLTGSFDEAVEKISEILRLQGTVIPGTLDRVVLTAHLKGGRVVRGEHHIAGTNLSTLSSLKLSPKARANPKALAAIRQAHLITIGPGNFYSSLLPVLLIDGLPKAIRQSRAKVVYISNLMTKRGHTDGFGVSDFVRVIEKYLGKPVDFVLYNNKKPSEKLLSHYAYEGEELVRWESLPHSSKTRYLGADLINRRPATQKKSDPLKRTLIRHDSHRIAKLLMGLLLETRAWI